MTTLVYLMVFAAAVLAAHGIHVMIQDSRLARAAAARRRLRHLIAAPNLPPPPDKESILRAEKADASLLDEGLRRLPGTGGLDVRLRRAGMETSPRRFVAGSLAIAGLAVAFGAALLGEVWVALPLAAAGVVPWLVLRRRERARMARFEQQFPEALELLTRALRAGHSLTVSLQIVAQELPDPIGGEFAQLCEEIRLGHDLRSALASLVERVDTPDLPFFATALLIQRESGGNLAEILENLGEVIRERFKLYGKVRALTATGRASANVLAAWPFVVVGGLYLANRDYVAPLWETPVGHMMAATCFGLVVIGYLLARRMATIRV